MFLALREIFHQPARFSLIMAAITLMAYMTFFLASLANGLAFSYRAAIDNWQATSVVITAESNENFAASRLQPSQVADVQAAAGGAANASPLLILPGVAEGEVGGTQVKSDIYVFGIEYDSFLSPQLVAGRAASDHGREFVVDDSLQQAGWQLGDKIHLATTDHAWEIVGFSHNNRFQTLPVAYLPTSQFAQLNMPHAVNAVVSRSPLSKEQLPAALQVLTTAEFINTLPGYRAQVLTFSTMIGALVLIAAFVLGIFLYVLSLQKQAVLGVLKARGVATAYLLRSSALQSLLLIGCGVAAGLLLSTLSGLVLPAAMPFRNSLLLDAAICVAFVLCALLGSLLSIRVVSRIDPVEAIS